MNSKFLARLYTSRHWLFVYMLLQITPSFSFWETCHWDGEQKIPLWSLIHTAKLTVTWRLYVWRLALYYNFIAVYPALQPSPWPGIILWADRCRVQPKHWRNSWLPVAGHITAKWDKDELSIYANAQGIWFPLMSVLHFSSVSAVFEKEGLKC